jgi:16S rRNA (adenine1518-N6/adenine1519-N6)-dimethyltransferase
VKKSLGQNFLVDPNVIRKIVRSGELEPGDLVLEVGGGGGALTAPLLETGARVIVLETDREWVEVLGATLGHEPRLTVVHADATKVDFADVLPAGERLVVFGNLPYNRAVDILMRLVLECRAVRRMVLMFQKEVADRMTAPSGSRTYGGLPVKLWPVATVERLFDVSSGCFRPRPKVTSTIVRVTPREVPLLAGDDLKRYFRLVQAAFTHRRKTLTNSLERAWPEMEEPARAELEARGLLANLRPEQLDPEFYRAVLERANREGAADEGTTP